MANAAARGQEKKRVWRHLAVGLAAIVAALALAVGAGALYCSYHPNIYLIRSRSSSDYQGRVFHPESIMLAFGEFRGVPVAEQVKTELRQVGDWLNEIDTELHEHFIPYSPYYIHVSGAKRGGEVTLRYEGIVTDATGQTTDYLRERTFRLPVRDRDLRLS